MKAEEEPTVAEGAGTESTKESILSYRQTYPKVFGLPILDDSMAPAYLPGNAVVIDPDQRWEDGATYLVKMDGGRPALKVFRDRGSQVTRCFRGPGGTEDGAASLHYEEEPGRIRM